MVAVVARKGRELQRYTSGGHRLVVGCIPYRLNVDKPSEITIDQALQVLVISSQKGQEILFPKGGWESDESIEEAACREAMEEAGVQGNIEEKLGEWWYDSKSQDSSKLGIFFPLKVTEELLHWPEMGTRKRRWVTAAEARKTCRQTWMTSALEKLVDRLQAATLPVGRGDSLVKSSPLPVSVAPLMRNCWSSVAGFSEVDALKEGRQLTTCAEHEVYDVLPKRTFQAYNCILMAYAGGRWRSVLGLYWLMLSAKEVMAFCILIRVSWSYVWGALFMFLFWELGLD